MKIFLASASLDDIAWAMRLRLIDGVLTTPELLAAERLDSERELLLDICRAAQSVVFVSAHALTSADVYRDARELTKLSDQIAVQVPFLEDTLDAMHRLAAGGVQVAATLVYSAAQAVLAARAGATAVILSIGDLDGAGHDAVAVLRDMRIVLDATDCEIDIVALHPTTPAQFTACAAAGADAVAVSADVLRTLLLHPLTDRGLDQLLHTLSKQHGAWSLV